MSCLPERRCRKSLGVSILQNGPVGHAAMILSGRQKAIGLPTPYVREQLSEAPRYSCSTPTRRLQRTSAGGLIYRAVCWFSTGGTVEGTAQPTDWVVMDKSDLPKLDAARVQ